MQRTFKKNLLALVSGFALFACFGLAASAADRVTARINEPIEFNGETYPAGTVQISEIQDYSPGATLNEIRVGGEWVGMVIARTVEGAPEADRASLVFTRNAAGTLVLEGMAMRNQPERRFMGFRSVDGQGEWYMPRQPAGTSLVARSGN